MKKLFFFVIPALVVLANYLILLTINNHAVEGLLMDNSSPFLTPLLNEPYPGDGNTSHSTSETPADNQNSSDLFSACLLVMDENHRLPEWLAYHYFMINLRHVVVLVDPASSTSPKDVTERWNGLIQFDVWTDEMIGFNETVAVSASGAIRVKGSRYKGKDQGLRVHAHRLRQRFFYKKCAAHLQRQKRSWTAFYDVDEYIYIDPDEVSNAMERMKQPGCIVKFIHEMQKADPNEPVAKLPLPYRNSANSGCIMIPRTYFGATESKQRNKSGHLPSCLNATDFETLRYFHRTSHDDFDNNGRGKSLLHISSVSSIESVGDRGVHGLVKSCKPPQSLHSPLRLRHYLGRWDVYSSRRADPRKGGFRSLQHYQYRAEFGKDQPSDDSVMPWLLGFCNQMQNNETLILRLFDGVGRLPPSSHDATNSQWSLSPLQIRDLLQGKKAEKTNTFSNWLKAHYKVESYTNGSVEVVRRTQ